MQEGVCHQQESELERRRDTAAASSVPLSRLPPPKTPPAPPCRQPLPHTQSFDEDFHFDCAEGRAQKLPPRIASWYTLCGKAHSNHELYLATVVGLGMAASFALAKMLLAPKTGGGGRGSTKGIKMEYSKKTM